MTENQIEIQIIAANKSATRLISFAETMFGPMVSRWQYEGVIFQDHSPHLSYSPETATVQISLSFKALDDEIQRDFQLAHEVCHLLYPSVALDNPVEPQTTVLNEGISTYFSVLIVGALYGGDAMQAVLLNLAA